MLIDTATQGGTGPADALGVQPLKSSLTSLLAVEPHATRGSARVFASLWAAGALGSWIMLALPELTIGHAAVLASALFCTAVAACVLSMSGRPGERWVAPASLAFGLPFAAVTIAATGGALSPGRGSLIFAVVFAAWAFPLWAAWAWEALTVAVYAAPLLYSEGLEYERFAAEALVQVPHWLGVAVAVMVAKRMLLRAREHAETLAYEQAALRRIATAATEAVGTDAVYDLVAEEVAGLTGASAAAVVRVQHGHRDVQGSWCVEGAAADLQRIGSGEDDASDLVTVPVRIEGRDWGVLSLVSGTARAPDHRRRLTEVAELLGLVIAAREGHRRLTEQATSDPLTGLANRRAFEARQETELARAARHDTPLVLALIDVDHLKEINDAGGHEAGDRQLRSLADALRAAARAEDFVARLGGDEFAWLLPEADSEQAVLAMERLRAGLGPSVSVGIAELRAGGDPKLLPRDADRALYEAKLSGRGTTRVFEAREDGWTSPR